MTALGLIRRDLKRQLLVQRKVVVSLGEGGPAGASPQVGLAAGAHQAAAAASQRSQAGEATAGRGYLTLRYAHESF